MKLYVFALVLLVAVLPYNARADVIVNYTGSAFDTVQGTGFVTGDRVLGTFTFANVGDTQAKAISLSATINGATTVFFNIPDVNSAPGLTIGTNSFGSWSGTLPTSWDVTIYGNAFGSAQDEQISIHNALGDLAAVDLTNALQAIGTNSTGGSFSAVPEPASATLFCISAMIVNFLGRRLRRNAKSG